MISPPRAGSYSGRAAPHLVTIAEAKRAPKGSVREIREWISARRLEQCDVETLTLREAAFLACLSTPILRYAIQSGTLPARRRLTEGPTPWRWEITRADLEAWLLLRRVSA